MIPVIAIVIVIFIQGVHSDFQWSLDNTIDISIYDNTQHTYNTTHIHKKNKHTATMKISFPFLQQISQEVMT